MAAAGVASSVTSRPGVNCLVKGGGSSPVGDPLRPADENVERLRGDVQHRPVARTCCCQRSRWRASATGASTGARSRPYSTCSTSRCVRAVDSASVPTGPRHPGVPPAAVTRSRSVRNPSQPELKRADPC